MAPEFQAPRGTFDVLPAESARRDRIYAAAADALERAGYGRIETPVFEDTELFARGVGASTDVVRKEMFTFADQGGRSVTLRPEATASICRAYIEHGMQTLPQPVKLWWYGPLFRHERPQAGRFRQFTQLDVEAIGSASSLVDAELIVLLDELLRGLGVPALELRLGSLGSVEARAAYREELRAYLRQHESGLSREVRERIDENPLRAFDAKDEGTQAVMANAPTMLDRLEAEDAEQFAAVRELLDQAGVDYSVDPTIVRGLDYYTRTVFEFHCGHLGAQSQVAGGGRYDGLIELLGGPPTPATGWAVGIERILLALDEPVPEPVADVFVVAPDGQRKRAFALVLELRRAGLRAELDLAERATRGQRKQADRIGARRAVILNEDGSAQVRDMASGEQRGLDLARAVEELAS
ncbi:MAG TPA: histidine--tRNA ligase [Solirubrobacterales bacterium]|jgi:histidyl-tRNA synthetase|nr:histidine--tRNA ligase [Solirubrobacterales bacterium]